MAGDTIAALATPPAPSARIILRLAGPAAAPITRTLCAHLQFLPSTASRATLRFSALQFPATLFTFPAPHSYTGDDLIEFHLPGNPILANLLLTYLLQNGARLANPGEFTARAFLAGKLDLTQAEGVAAVISAANAAQLAAARQLLAGELARRLTQPMEQLAQTLALVEAGIDFADEGISFLQADDIRSRAANVQEQIDNLLATADRFDQLPHEPRIVLLGRPNAGKSTLINALTQTPRAVISPTPGTTRDVLSAPLDLPRGRVILQDVAGLDTFPPGDSPQHSIDTQAQSMAARAAESSQHMILIQEANDPRPAPPLPRPPDLLVLTKADQFPHASPKPPALLVSAHTGAGLPALRQTLDRLAFGSPNSESRLALTARHLTALAEARASLQRLTDPLPAELLAADLREALTALGQVLGQITPDEILGRIFSQFCIGK